MAVILASATDYKKDRQGLATVKKKMKAKWQQNLLLISTV